MPLRPVIFSVFAVVLAVGLSAARAANAPAPPSLTSLLATAVKAPQPPTSAYLEIYINQQPGILENVPGCSTQLYGQGVGIYDAATQYTLSEKEVRGLLKLFQDRNFLALPETIGESGIDPRSGRPVLQSSRITLKIAGQSKSVSQLPFGEQSKDFAAIAQGAQRLVAAAVKRSGVVCDDLKKGLAMLEKGQLRPEVFSGQCLTYKLGPKGADGWQLVWAGGTLQAHALRGGAPKEPHRMAARPQQITALVKALQEEGFDRFPMWIYFPGSADLNAYVLKGSHALQGKSINVYHQKATPDDEKRLARLVDRLKAVYEEVMKDGEEVKNP